jgi:hypothetical protein
VLSFSNEAKRLPFPESTIEPKWLQSRLAICLADAHPTAAPAKEKTASPLTGKVAAPRAKPFEHTPSSKPISPAAKTLEKRIEALAATLTDDDLYDVQEGSITDFDRAMQ